MKHLDFQRLNPNLRTIGTNRQWERGIDCDITVCCDEYQLLYTQEHADNYTRATVYTRPQYAKKWGARTVPSATAGEIGGSMAIRVAATFNPRTVILAGYDAHRWGVNTKWQPSDRHGHAGPRSLDLWHQAVDSAIQDNQDIQFIWANTTEEFALYCYA